MPARAAGARATYMGGFKHRMKHRTVHTSYYLLRQQQRLYIHCSGIVGAGFALQMGLTAGEAGHLPASCGLIKLAQHNLPTNAATAAARHRTMGDSCTACLYNKVSSGQVEMADRDSAGHDGLHSILQGQHAATVHPNSPS
eukprot:GHRR01009601.1.p4 GENE.GHRR01009601.1~~GHRR01009601.1.p4  ORF type:complete len:141 (+),score=45.92 GHRR01009601.1:84-506(+)